MSQFRDSQQCNALRSVTHSVAPHILHSERCVPCIAFAANTEFTCQRALEGRLKGSGKRASHLLYIQLTPITTFFFA